MGFYHTASQGLHWQKAGIDWEPEINLTHSKRFEQSSYETEDQSLGFLNAHRVVIILVLEGHYQIQFNH